MNYTTCQDEKFSRRLVDLEKKGDKVLGHRHAVDHVTKLRSGSVFLRAWVLGTVAPLIEGKFIAPAEILIKKDWHHEFEALEDGTLAECVFEEQALSAPVL